MQRNLRKLIGGTVAVAVAVAALAVPAAVAPTHDSETVASAAHTQAAGKCRWVWRIGLVCETKTGTITL